MYELLRNLSPYIRDRVQARLFVPMAIFLVLAAKASAQEPLEARLLQWPVMVAFTYSLILQWRLWDDLKDRTLDQEKHPRRLLSQVSDIKPYYAVLFILILLNGLAVLLYQDNTVRGVAYGAAYAAAILFFSCWYRQRPASATHGLLNSHLVLLKYPFIVWLTAEQPQHIAILVSVYLSCLALELAHDTVLRRRYTATLGLYLGLLFACWLYIVMTHSPVIPLFQWIWPILLTGVAVYYVVLFMRYSLYLSYGVIGVSSLIYFTLILEKA